jgi:hypothetical protein
LLLQFFALNQGGSSVLPSNFQNSLNQIVNLICAASISHAPKKALHSRIYAAQIRYASDFFMKFWAGQIVRGEMRSLANMSRDAAHIFHRNAGRPACSRSLLRAFQASVRVDRRNQDVAA